MPERRRIQRASQERRSIERLARERLTVKIPHTVIERLRNAVYYTDGLTISGFIEQSIITGVDAMETARGKAFPERRAQLRPGRPPKAG